MKNSVIMLGQLLFNGRVRQETTSEGLRSRRKNATISAIEVLNPATLVEASPIEAVKFISDPLTLGLGQPIVAGAGEEGD